MVLETLQSLLQYRTRAGFEWRRTASQRLLARAADVTDLRLAARDHLPRGVFDYVDGGAEEEVTVQRNGRQYRDDLMFHRPRVLRDVSNVDCSKRIFAGRRRRRRRRRLPQGHKATGEETEEEERLRMPIILAPTGFTRMVYPPQGECAVARAAARFGIPYTLSTMSTTSIEHVASCASSSSSSFPDHAKTNANDRNLWFQVYTWRDRGLVRELLSRARACRYHALVITVDVPVLGRRDRDVRSGFTLPPALNLSTALWDGLMHPGWTWDLIRSEPIRFANFEGKGGAVDGTTAVQLMRHINSQFDSSLSWEDISWYCDEWSNHGPVIIKGIQSVEDAILAMQCDGVDGIVLSNHGGRQLDGAPTSLDLVASVREAVGGDDSRIDIYCDGGVRRGSDVVKAIALGADAVMIGRPYLYALGAAGESGMDWLLDYFYQGIQRTMALTGCTTMEEITPDLVRWRSRK